MQVQSEVLTQPRDVAQQLERRAEDIAVSLLGKPSTITTREMRWGRNGSLWLSRSGAKRGRWFDHERGEGGDLLDLISRERDVGTRAAMDIARDMLGARAHHEISKRLPSPRRLDESEGDRLRHALKLWREAVCLRGTPGEHYFIRHRQLDVTRLPLHHVLRWHHRIEAVLALMTDALTGAPVGVHRTFLDSHGQKRERRMLGHQGVVRLSPDEEIACGLGVAEGIEDALAVLLSGWTPVWAATSAGAIARLPLVPGIDTLTVFADADEAGMAAADVCCRRWQNAGREVVIASPLVVR